MDKRTITIQKGIAIGCAASLLIAGLANTTTDAKVKVKLSKTKVTVTKGTTKTIKLSGVKSKVKWSISDKKKAFLSPFGKYKEKCKIKAKKTGKVKVTAKYKGKKYICAVTIIKAKNSKAKATPSAEGTTQPSTTTQPSATSQPPSSQEADVTLEKIIAANRTEDLIKKYGSISAESREKNSSGSKGYSRYVDSELYYIEESTHREVMFDNYSYIYETLNKEYDVRFYPQGGLLKDVVYSGFLLSESGTRNETIISCTRKGNEITLVTGQDEKKFGEVMGNVSEETREEFCYKEGDREESVFVMDADTLELKKLTTTIYHRDDSSDFSRKHICSYGEKRPSDIKSIVSHNTEGSDTAKITLVMNPETENEIKQTVSAGKDAFYYVNDSDNYHVWFADKEMREVSSARGYLDDGDVTLYTKNTLTEKDITVGALSSANCADRLFCYFDSVLAKVDGYERYLENSFGYSGISGEDEHILSWEKDFWAVYGQEKDVYAGVAYIGDAVGTRKKEVNNIFFDGTSEDEKLISATVGDDGDYRIETEWKGDSYREYGRRYKGYVEGGYAKCVYTVDPDYWLIGEKEILFCDAGGEVKSTVKIDMEYDASRPEKARELMNRLAKANITVTLVVEPGTQDEKTYYVLTDAQNDIRVKCGKNQTAVLFTDRECTKRYYSGNADLTEDRTIYAKLAKTSDVSLEDMLRANTADNILGKYKSVYSVRTDGKDERYQSGKGAEHVIYNYGKYEDGYIQKALLYKNTLYEDSSDGHYVTFFPFPKTHEITSWRFNLVLDINAAGQEQLEASVDNGDGTVTLYTRSKSTESFAENYNPEYEKPYAKGDIGLFSYTVRADDFALLSGEEQISHADGRTERTPIGWTVEYNADKPSGMKEVEKYYDIANGFRSEGLRHIDFVMNYGKENETVYTAYAKKGEKIYFISENIAEDGRVVNYDLYRDEKYTEDHLFSDEDYENSCTLYMKERNEGGNVTYASSVTKEMCRPEYWLNRMEEPDKVLMSYEEIRKLNASMLATKAANMNDLEHMADTYDVEKLGKNLANLEVRSDKTYYINGVKLTDRDGYFSGMSANVLSGGAVTVGSAESGTEDTGTAKISYAVCVKRGELRVWPTSDYAGYSATDRDDEIVNAALDVNEPFVAKYVTGDGKYIWGYSNNCTGWIEAEKLAICADKEEWLDAWKVKNQNILVVTGDKVTLEKSVLDSEVSEMELMIGTCLKLVPEDKIPKLVGERGTWNNYVVYVPVRNADGSYRKRMALVSQKASVNIGYLPLTQANVIKTALSCLGNRYGWGGMLGAMDCSLYNRSVYRCFGLEIPRNTTWQQEIPGKVTKFAAVSDKTEEDALKNKAALDERKKLLDEAPAGSMLYFSGHTMMYLGKVDGKYYVISALGSLYDIGDTSVRYVYSVAVNTLDVRRGNGSTWLANLCGIVSF